MIQTSSRELWCRILFLKYEMLLYNSDCSVIYFLVRSKFPPKNTQSPVKTPRGQEAKRESPKQVPTRESPVKRDRMSPSSAAPMAFQQERRSLDRREEVTGPPTQRENVTGTSTVRENGTPMSGRSETSAYEPAGLGLAYENKLLVVYLCSEHLCVLYYLYR